MARYNSVNATAANVANTPFQTYSNDPNAFVAPMNLEQNAAMGNTNTYANSAQPYYGAATGMTMAGAGAANPTALNGQAINQYMSPFLSNVYNTTVATENQQNKMQASQLQGQAIGAGAFGGDRSGVAAANLAYQQNLANAQANAGILNTGYNTALQTAQQQQGVGLSAEQANLARMTGAGQQMAAIGTTAQQQGLAGAQQQMAMGTTAQQTQQQGLTALYNQFLQQQAYPFQTTQFLANIAEGTGALSGSDTRVTQPSSFFSDERLKENVHKIGETYDGQTIYRYNLKGDDATRIGFMAGETEHHHPDAVGLAGGYKTVDYDKATRGAAHRGHFDMGGLAGADALNQQELAREKAQQQAQAAQQAQAQAQAQAQTKAATPPPTAAAPPTPGLAAAPAAPSTTPTPHATPAATPATAPSTPPAPDTTGASGTANAVAPKKGGAMDDVLKGLNAASGALNANNWNPENKGNSGAQTFDEGVQQMSAATGAVKSFMARGGLAPHHEGGGVQPWRAGLGFADGGVPDDPQAKPMPLPNAPAPAKVQSSTVASPGSAAPDPSGYMSSTAAGVPAHQLPASNFAPANKGNSGAQTMGQITSLIGAVARGGAIHRERHGLGFADGGPPTAGSPVGEAMPDYITAMAMNEDNPYGVLANPEGIPGYYNPSTRRSIPATAKHVAGGLMQAAPPSQDAPGTGVGTTLTGVDDAVKTGQSLGKDAWDAGTEVGKGYNYLFGEDPNKAPASTTTTAHGSWRGGLARRHYDDGGGTITPLAVGTFPGSGGSGDGNGLQALASDIDTARGLWSLGDKALFGNAEVPANAATGAAEQPATAGLLGKGDQYDWADSGLKQAMYGKAAGTLDPGEYGPPTPATAGAFGYAGKSGSSAHAPKRGGEHTGYWQANLADGGLARGHFDAGGADAGYMGGVSAPQQPPPQLQQATPPPQQQKKSGLGGLGGLGSIGGLAAGGRAGYAEGGDPDVESTPSLSQGNVYHLGEWLHDLPPSATPGPGASRFATRTDADTPKTGVAAATPAPAEPPVAPVAAAPAAAPAATPAAPAATPAAPAATGLKPAATQALAPPSAAPAPSGVAAGAPAAAPGGFDMDAYQKGTAFAESGGKADATNTAFSVDRGGPLGLDQFTGGTWMKFVAANPQLFKGMTADQTMAARANPDLSRQATAWLANQNIPVLQQAGIPITNENVYAAHVLGAQGAVTLLQNPDQNALTALTSIFGPNEAKKVLAQNGGNADMTAGDFVHLHTGRFDKGIGVPDQGVRGGSGGLSGPGSQPGVAGGSGGGQGVMGNLSPEAYKAEQASAKLSQQPVQGSNSWFGRNQDWLVPLMGGLGTMASSNSRYLGSAILQGLAGGASAWEGTQDQMQQRQTAQIANEQSPASVESVAAQAAATFGQGMVALQGTDGSYTFYNKFAPQMGSWHLDPTTGQITQGPAPSGLAGGSNGASPQGMDIKPIALPSQRSQDGNYVMTPPDFSNPANLPNTQYSQEADKKYNTAHQEGQNLQFQPGAVNLDLQQFQAQMAADQQRVNTERDAQQGIGPQQAQISTFISDMNNTPYENLGAASPLIQKVMAWGNGYAPLLGIEAPFSTGTLANYEGMDKLAKALNISLANTVGNDPGFETLRNVQSAIPSAQVSPRGLAERLSFMQSMVSYANTKASFDNAYMQKHHSLIGAPEEFAATYPIGQFTNAAVLGGVLKGDIDRFNGLLDSRADPSVVAKQVAMFNSAYGNNAGDLMLQQYQAEHPQGGGGAGSP